MAVASHRFGEGDLLEYNAEHKVVICRKCKYAIQKSALESHLLRHKIYRHDRVRLMTAIAQLDIFDPDDVSPPPPDSPPIAGLPVLAGIRCTIADCGHLTISNKRMKSHWKEAHEGDGFPSMSSPTASSVHLQTFFRGTKVRYFQVSAPDGGFDQTNVTRTERNHDPREHESDFDSEMVEVPSLQVKPRATLASTTHSSSPADFSLETLTYFHQLCRTTSLTLPPIQPSSISFNYWQGRVIPWALQQHWLMCGLLAVSAQHLAVLAVDPEMQRTHRQRHDMFLTRFQAGLRNVREGVSETTVTAATGDIKACGETISSVLRCAQVSTTMSDLHPGISNLFDIDSLVSNIRQCILVSASLNPHDQYSAQLKRLPASMGLALASLNAQEGTDNVPCPILDRLRTLPFHIAERLGRPRNPQDVLATLSSITTMIRCCELSFARDVLEAAFSGVATWLADASPHFQEMLSDGHPAALIVLAHWAAVLVKRVERLGAWFLIGYADAIVAEVARKLSAHNGTLIELVNDLSQLNEN